MTLNDVMAAIFHHLIEIRIVSGATIVELRQSDLALNAYSVRQKCNRKNLLDDNV